MTIPIIALIGIAVVSAGIGFATATLLAAGGRADLEAEKLDLKLHIIRMRNTLKKAHEKLLEQHRMFGVGKWQIFEDIETTVEATFDDEIF